MSQRPSEVLIVGAGPTGLLLAAELERRDVSPLLIDAHDAPLGWDRATIAHSRSMEIFEALGLADRFLDQGVKSGAVRIRSGGRILGLMDFSALESRYPFDVGISEQVTESILTDHLSALGGEVTRGTRLAGLRPGAHSVTATLEHDGEQRDFEASWVVGCDGYHSAIRELVGIEFPGSDIEAPWAVFDASLEGWEEELDVQAAFLDVPTVILTPLPGGRWRVYLRPTSEESDLVADAAETVNRYFPDVLFAGVENAVRFRCHSRIASSYRSGRVLLAGDAAHVCTPAEGHGMNTGLQDAFNLGWKLAHVCQGDSGPALLDSYEVERRPVAERVVGSGDAVEGQQSMTPAERAERDKEIRRTFAASESAHHEAVGAAEIDRSYAGSGVVAGDSHPDLGPGDRLPDTDPVEPPDGGPRPLHQLTHAPGHTLFVLGGPDAAATEVSDLTGKLEEAHSESPLVSAVIGLCANPEGEPIGRIGPSIADHLGIYGTTVLAVRPDRYVGLREDAPDPDAVKRYLEALAA